ncbi:transcription antitermination factor NusB [Blattabacterium cuenoti]|uniref:transcription antitermination factor NusB n=1 Tax=Blattabacterium cuenoti TaxID=1653831 RepID=UPI00163C23D9|nr:transcription antitermination factor NusB [Blattabacterium cuenoti]
MSIRRHFRIRSLQYLYSLHLSKMDSKQVEKFLLQNIEELNKLYILLLCMILKMKEKAVKLYQKISSLNKNSQINYTIKNLAYNSIIEILSNNKYLLQNSYFQNILWKKNDQHVFLLFKKIINFIPIQQSIDQEQHCASFKEEKKFLMNYYKIYFIQNKKLMKYIDDVYINGKEDLLIAHRMVYKTLHFINDTTPSNFRLYNIYFNENKKFIINLYRNTISHKKEFNNLINKVSNNWDIKRIGMVDLIILQMAICEFLYFPNIPPKATINEYIEISKIFCMDKSKIFVNGILDRILKILYKENKIY